MGFYNRRNALVGYLTVRAASQYLKRRRRRRQLKIAAFVVLGLVSLGLLAGLAAAFTKRRREVAEEVEDVVEQLGDDVAAGAEAASAEPIPAT